MASGFLGKNKTLPTTQPSLTTCKPNAQWMKATLTSTEALPPSAPGRLTFTATPFISERTELVSGGSGGIILVLFVLSFVRFRLRVRTTEGVGNWSEPKEAKRAEPSELCTYKIA